MSSSSHDREIAAPIQGVSWNEEDWQGVLKRLQSRLGRTSHQAQSVATHTQTGLCGRFAASASGVCRLWVFLSAVGAVGHAHGSGLLIGASVAQAAGASPGLDRLVAGSRHRDATVTRLVAHHDRTDLVGRCQSIEDASRKRRRCEAS